MAFEFFNTLGPSPKSLSSEAFHDYVKSLYIKPESKVASCVDGVNISFGKRTVVRNSRNPKYVTEKELWSLAGEYSKTFTELWNLMKARKIEIRR